MPNDENVEKEKKEQTGQDAGETPQPQKEDIKEQEQPKDKKEKKRTKTEQLEEQLADLNDRYLRLAAEYDNFRKRSARERDSIYPEATANAVSAFLEVADDMERALGAECSDPEFKKGLELTYKALSAAFEKLNVAPFGQKGEPFDPNCHNAVMHIEDDSVDSSVVAEVYQKGYRLGDRVIRHAMVQVKN